MTALRCLSGRKVPNEPLVLRDIGRVSAEGCRILDIRLAEHGPVKAHLHHVVGTPVLELDHQSNRVDVVGMRLNVVVYGNVDGRAVLRDRPEQDDGRLPVDAVVDGVGFYAFKIGRPPVQGGVELVPALERVGRAESRQQAAPRLLAGEPVERVHTVRALIVVPGRRGPKPGVSPFVV